MIHSYSFHNKNNVRKNFSPQLDTFLIQISNPGCEVSFDEGYLGTANYTFVDDYIALPTTNIMTIEQGQELVSLIDELNDNPELIEIIICCDTGNTASGAVAKFISENYSRAKNYQSLDGIKLNKHILSTLRMTTYSGVKPSFLDMVGYKLEQFGWDIADIVELAFTRNPVENALALLQWFKREF